MFDYRCEKVKFRTCATTHNHASCCCRASLPIIDDDGLLRYTIRNVISLSNITSQLEWVLSFTQISHPRGAERVPTGGGGDDESGSGVGDDDMCTATLLVHVFKVLCVFCSGEGDRI